MPWETEERKEEYHSETAAVTITLSTGFFVFEYVKIVDSGGVERYVFSADENIYFSCKIVNTGEVKDTCRFQIVDTDTGAVKLDTSFSLDPGKFNEYYKAALGKMPARDLHLHFIVSP